MSTNWVPKSFVFAWQRGNHVPAIFLKIPKSHLLLFSLGNVAATIFCPLSWNNNFFRFDSKNRIRLWLMLIDLLENIHLISFHPFLGLFFFVLASFLAVTSFFVVNLNRGTRKKRRIFIWSNRNLNLAYGSNARMNRFTTFAITQWSMPICFTP